MDNKLKKPTGKQYAIAYHVIRNITSPEDSENDRKIYSGQIPIQSVIDLPTDENVRDYLLEAEGRARRRPTQVHNAIKETLINHPDNFSVLNSGVTIVAHDIIIDEKEKTMFLKNPSIINGAQTQGVIKDFFKDYDLPTTTHIKCEVIVTTDDAIIADVSIARNYQNDVMNISIAGRKGQLDELERSLQKVLPETKLRKSETDLASASFVDTEKLIQVIIALIPSQIWYKTGEQENPNKVFTYSQKSKCLKDFQDIYSKAKNIDHPDHQKSLILYNFFLDTAPIAYNLYNHWKKQQEFYGTKLRTIERGDHGEIVDIPDGIVFPIISSLSVFMVKGDKKWELNIPDILKNQELIKAAKSVYMDIAGHNPQTMGKSRACYAALLQITTIYNSFKVQR